VIQKHVCENACDYARGKRARQTYDMRNMRVRESIKELQ
jgi:hypothetical protein